MVEDFLMIRPRLKVKSRFTHFLTEEGVDRAVEAVMYMGKIVETANGEDHSSPAISHRNTFFQLTMI